MSFQATCPECQTEYSLADKLHGKTIRCKNCQKPFRAECEEIESEPSDTPADKKSNRPRLAETDTNSKTERRPRRDEDEDRSRKKPRKKTKKPGSSKALVIGLIGGIVFLAAVVVLIIVLGGKKGTDKRNEGVEEASKEQKSDTKDNNQNTQAANTNVLSTYASRVAVDSTGWVHVDRTVTTPGFAALCSWGQDESNKACTVYDLKVGKNLGSFQLTGVKVLQKAALSPKATYLATEQMRMVNANTFDREITLWSLPEGRAVFTNWRPYPSASTADPRYAEHQLAWMGYTDANRLLTVTAGGRVSLWSMPDCTPIYDKRPLTPQPNKQPGLDIYSWEAKNLALSPDRKTLAIQQGDGVLLLNTATGEPTGALPELEGVGQQTQMQGMAFSPDGTRLACSIQGVVGDRTRSVQQSLATWDIVKKKVNGISRLPQTPDINALSWWGNHHVFGMSGGLNGLVINVDTGKPVRQCLSPSGGRFANGQLDGQLWFSTSLISGRVSLISYAAPDEFLAKDPEANAEGFYKSIELTTNGVEKVTARTIPKVRFDP